MNQKQIQRRLKWIDKRVEIINQFCWERERLLREKCRLISEPNLYDKKVKMKVRK